MKKAVSLVMAAVLAITTLTGCSGADSGKVKIGVVQLMQHESWTRLAGDSWMA